jgi:hypothetical protein
MWRSDVSERGVASEDVSDMVAACVALEQVRTVRRLLVARCAFLVAVVASVGTLLHGLSLVARCCSIALVATPPILAWIVEVRLAQRLGTRVPGGRKS